MKHKVEFKVGDCRDELKKLTNAVSLTITSPPYNANKAYENYNDNLTFQEYKKFTLEWMDAVRAASKPDGRLALNVPDVSVFEEQVHFMVPLFAQWVGLSGWNLMDIVTWIKTGSITADELRASSNSAWGSWQSPSNPHLRSISESILICYNQRRKKDGSKEDIDITADEFRDWTHNVWAIRGETHPTHPAVFPIELPHRLLKLYSFKNDLILDPFSGSGTVGLECWRLNRNFIGFDVSQKYTDEANRELKKLREQTTLSRYV